MVTKRCNVYKGTGHIEQNNSQVRDQGLGEGLQAALTVPSRKEHQTQDFPLHKEPQFYPSEIPFENSSVGSIPAKRVEMLQATCEMKVRK